jgi:hypothetical protein
MIKTNFINAEISESVSLLYNGKLNVLWCRTEMSTRRIKIMFLGSKAAAGA